MNLADYGFIPSMMPEDVSGTPARITAVHKERYELICEHGHIFGRLKSSTYYLGGLEDFPTTGDFVLVNYNPSGDSQIIKTLNRKSFFSRRDPTPGRGEQAVAANFDYVFIMLSDCGHETEPGCAVRAAIKSGELPSERWDSYLKLKREARFSDDKGEYLRQKQQWHKDIAKWSKQMKKNGGFKNKG